MNASELLDRIKLFPHDQIIFNMPLVVLTPYDSDDPVVRDYMVGCQDWFGLCFNASRDQFGEEIFTSLLNNKKQSKQFERDFALSVADLIRYLEKLPAWEHLLDQYQVLSTFEILIDSLHINQTNYKLRALDCAIAVKEILG